MVGSHIDQNNLYYHYKNFRELTKTFNYENQERIPVQVISTNLGTYFFAPILDWEKSTGYQYTMKEYDLVGDGSLSKFLQGKWQKDMMVEPEFKLDFIKAGSFKMYVETASYVGAMFSISLDNQVMLTQSYPEL